MTTQLTQHSMSDVHNLRFNHPKLLGDVNKKTTLRSKRYNSD